MALVYSCCFWISLRLAGILIGVLSIMQATIFLSVLIIGCKLSQDVKLDISTWMKEVDLLYFGDILEKFLSDSETYIPYIVTFYCLYIFICVLYIYGAYMCNNILMVAFILVELIRLIMLSISVTTWLLILKQNTMDIGLVIGASVASGFVLLGMFYLWVCAANLPILINEMEREEQQATIIKLQRLLETTNHKTNYGKYVSFNNEGFYRRNPFIIQTSRNNYNEPYYSSFIN